MDPRFREYEGGNCVLLLLQAGERNFCTSYSWNPERTIKCTPVLLAGTYLYPYYGRREFHLEHGRKDRQDHCNSGRDYYMVHQGSHSVLSLKIHWNKESRSAEFNRWQHVSAKLAEANFWAVRDH